MAKDFDVYQTVTDSIIAALEKGVRPWTRPWSAPEGVAAMPLRHDGKPYQGVNVWLLWLASAANGYANPRWMTYKQAETYKAHVRKGEHGTLTVFFRPITKQETTATGAKEEKTIRLIRYSKVFNVEQIDGLPERFYQKPVALESTPSAILERIERAEKFFAGTGSIVRHGGYRAFYSTTDDFIGMPEFATFTDAESYYATIAHEHVHWTGAKNRLNREFGKRFGDGAYAAEELVAEMGSAFLCATLGLTLVPREDHAAYLGHWLKVLKADKKAIFTASRAAQDAVTHLNKLAGVDEAASGEPEEIREAA